MYLRSTINYLTHTGQTTFNASSVSSSNFSMNAFFPMFACSQNVPQTVSHPLRRFFHSSWAFLRLASALFNSAWVTILAPDFLNGASFLEISSISFSFSAISSWIRLLVSPMDTSLNFLVRSFVFYSRA